jgi:ABC-type glycerol-3-phosphate transport system permease component
VIIPVAVPGVITAIVISFVMSWNEFPFVLAFTTSPRMRTLPYQLYLLRDTLGVIDWPLINAYSIITMLPILLTYIAFERYIVRGLTSGSLK